MVDGSNPPATAYIPPPAPSTITITFNLNATGDSSAAFEGTFAGSTVINQGAQIGALPSATRDGYLLTGWTTTADDGTTAITATTTFSADGSVYALWVVDAVAAPPIDVEIDVADVTATGNATVDAIDGGYKITYGTVDNSNYGSPNAWFKLDFTELGITDLTEIKSIAFVFTPIAGDVKNKDIYLAASATSHGWANDDTYATETISNTKSTGELTADDLNEGIDVELLLDQTKVADLTDATFFVIRIHANNKGALPTADSVTSFSVANIQLIPFAEE